MSYPPVYLDYNATTPVDPEVIKRISETLSSNWANPSSSYEIGKTAKNVIEKSREEMGKLINCDPNDIIFMSGGTEANNVAIHSAVSRSLAKNLLKGLKPHVISSNVEHDSVIKYLSYLEQKGEIELSLAPVDKMNSLLDLNNVLALIKQNTVLITLMHANNETGALFPISGIGAKLIQINSARIKENLPPIYFHTDAAQTIGKISVDVTELNVDYLTIVGHKFYGPRIGALYAKSTVNEEKVVYSLQFGGGQEKGFRPGTENTPMIAGLGKAASLITSNQTHLFSHLKNLRDLLREKLIENIPGLKINFLTPEKDAFYLPNTLSICLPAKLSASQILKKCSGEVNASLGAACHSNEERPSEILIKSGLSEDEAKRTIRLSVGKYTKDDDINSSVKALRKACI